MTEGTCKFCNPKQNYDGDLLTHLNGNHTFGKDDLPEYFAMIHSRLDELEKRAGIS
jgi:hypothetical protein